MGTLNVGVSIRSGRVRFESGWLWPDWIMDLPKPSRLIIGLDTLTHIWHGS